MSVFVSGKGWKQVNARKTGALVDVGKDPKNKRSSGA